MIDPRLRPVVDEDLGFLRELYGSTRADEMRRVPWTEAEKTAFLNMQFEAQQRFYQERFPGASFDVVEASGTAVGRLYVDRRPDEIRLIDIALLPAWRRRGLGSALLDRVLSEAEAAAKPVRIHVERNNPALGLYERLGFERIEDQGVYYLMEWRPAVLAAAGREAGA